MKRVAVTGGIGCGKSTVLAMVAARGVPVLDADRLARDAVAPGTPGLAAVVARFGEDVLSADGSLDRERLGRRVFSDGEARSALEAITHPLIGALMAERLAALEDAAAPIVAIEVPLLFEKNMEGAFDATIAVVASRERASERLAARNGWDEAEIARRMASQLPVEEKARRADHVIRNDGSREHTAAEVDAVLERLRATA